MARLEIAPLAVSDAEEMVAVLGDERLYAFTGGRPPTVAELRARYARAVALEVIGMRRSMTVVPSSRCEGRAGARISDPGGYRFQSANFAQTNGKEVEHGEGPHRARGLARRVYQWAERRR